MKRLGIVCMLMIAGCSDQDALTDAETNDSAVAGNPLLGALTDTDTNDSTLVGKSLLEAIAYWNNPDEFKNCQSGELEPIENVWVLSKDAIDQHAPFFVGHTGNDLAFKVIEFAEDLDVELPARRRDQIVMFQLKIAADQGSPVAMNEIGSSLLYCYQHVEQNLEGARRWFENAAKNGDDYAMRSLAKMHILRMTDVEQPELVAHELLSKCAELGNEDCVADLSIVAPND